MAPDKRTDGPVVGRGLIFARTRVQIQVSAYRAIYLVCNTKGVLRQNGAFGGGYKRTIDFKPLPAIVRGYGSLLKYLLTADSAFPIDYWP